MVHRTHRPVPPTGNPADSLLHPGIHAPPTGACRSGSAAERGPPDSSAKSKTARASGGAHILPERIVTSCCSCGQWKNDPIMRPYYVVRCIPQSRKVVAAASPVGTQDFSPLTKTRLVSGDLLRLHQSAIQQPHRASRSHPLAQLQTCDKPLRKSERISRKMGNSRADALLEPSAMLSGTDVAGLLNLHHGVPLSLPSLQELS